MDIPTTLDQINSLSGIATLVNALLLWPIIKSLRTMAKASDLRHAATEARVDLLEDHILPKRKRPSNRKGRKL